jgi:Fe-S-cluster containining protein
LALEKVIARPLDINELRGYQIEITSDEATVADYLAAVNKFIDHEEYHRSRNVVTTCEGCPHCCNERIPLTNIDIENLANHPHVGSNPLKEQIKTWGFVYLEGPSIDISIQRNHQKRCVFLNDKTDKCMVYYNRPLVCQTFICCPVEDSSQELRSIIVNLGEDQLVRDWLSTHVEGEMMHIDDANEPEIALADWENNLFHQKKSYDEVFLIDLLPRDLWNKLRSS